MMDHDGRELDLDILSTSWRSMSDRDAWEQMLHAWERKLAAVKRQPRIPLLDNLLRQQLSSLDELLDDRRDFQAEDPVERAVSDTTAPVMVLSPDGLVDTMNNGAERYFGVKQGMRAGTDWLREDSLSDYSAVRSTSPGKSNIDYAVVRMRGDDDVPVFSEVYKIEVDDTLGTYTVVRSLDLDWHESVSEALSKAFGMTEAETQICELIFAYRDVAIVAEKRSVGLETVRSQVKSILSKVEVHSKTELVRLLALLCSSAASKQEKVDLTWKDPLGRERIFTRRDGRRLAYSWVGAEAGRPVLYVPGQTSFNFFPEQIRDRLEREGIKMFVLSLPGHGNSDPDRETDQLIDGCDGIEEWCEAMSSGPLPVMASRGAQFYIFRLAKLRPDLFSFLLCMGLPWNITPKRTECVGAGQITLMKLSQDAPAAFDVVCRIAHRIMKKHGPDFYWKKAYSGNEADAETSKDIEIRPLLRATVQHISAQGYEAFKREQEMCARSPISEWVKDTQVPFHWMVPGLTVQLEEEDFKEVQRLNPVSTLEVIGNAGELIPFQKPDIFIDRLLVLASNDPEKAFAEKFGNTMKVHRSG